MKGSNMKKGILLFATAATAMIVGTLFSCNSGGGGGNPATVTYAVTTASNPDEGGTVSPAGTTTYSAGTEIIVTATANDGYEFAGWVGVPSSVNASSASITFNVEGNLSLIANFKLEEGDDPEDPEDPPVVTYTLTTNVSPSAGGTVTINGETATGTTTHEDGTEVEVCAAGNGEYEFAGWSGASTSATPCVSIIMDENKNITATFERQNQTAITHTLTVTPSPSIGGTITVDGAATIGATTFDYGTELEVCALEASGYKFTGWSGGSSSANGCINIVMNNDISLTANFLQTYTLTTNANPSSGGSVFVDDVELSAGTRTFDAGTSITVRAVASADHEFTNWIGAPTSVNAQHAEITFEINSNVTLIANFINTVVPPTPHTLTTNITPSGGGTVTRVPNLANYDAGTLVTVTANAANGFRFIGWTGALTSSERELAFNVNTDMTLTANFQRMRTLTVNNISAVRGSVTVEGVVTTGTTTHDDGAEITITASPAAGYRFVNWSGASTSTNATISLSMTSDRSLTATFRRVYTLTVTRNPLVGGTVNVNNITTHDSASVVSVVATANADYQFANWSGASTSSNASISVTMNGDRELTANFQLQPRTLTITRVPTIGGSVTVNGTTSTGTTSHAFGSEVEVCAAAASGYHFSDWSGASTATTPCVTLVMNSNRTLIATFAPLRTLTVARNLAVGGTVSVGGTTVLGSGTATTNATTHNNGASVQICATPASNHEFTGWSGASMSANSCVTATMSLDVSLTANFRSLTRTLTVSRNLANGGTVSVNGTAVLGSGTTTTHTSTYNNGASVEVCATPNENYEFNFSGVPWADGRCVMVMMDQDISVAVTFAIIRWSFLVVRDPVAGNVSINGILMPPNNTHDNMVFNQGALVEVCAIPNNGYYFRGWGETGTSDPCMTYVIDRYWILPITFWECTPNINCPTPTDVGRCTINGVCTNNVQRQNCAGTFVFNATCTLIGSFTDSRDDQTYRYVTIGTQTWMAENLNFAGSGGNTVGVCYDNDVSNCAIYGRLYRWVEAMNIDQQYETSFWSGISVDHRGICPVGWYLPSTRDWSALVSFVGTNAGTKLKSQTGWSAEEYWWGESYIPGTNEFGFSALPGGLGVGDGFFSRAGLSGFWWSSWDGGAGTDGTNALMSRMHSDSEHVSWADRERKHSEFSVRCVRD